MSKEVALVVSMPSGFDFPVAPGSVDVQCDFCPRRLALSPASQPLVAKGALPVCPVCMILHRLADDDGPQITDAVRKEVEAKTGGVSPEEIMGDADPHDALSILAARILKRERDSGG